jgi:hypothetical protein
VEIVDKRKTRWDTAIIGVSLLAGIVLLTWFHFLSPASRANREARAAGREIQLALDKYASAHGGEYPSTSAILGGENVNDTLLKGSYIKFYPNNPFHKQRPMAVMPDCRFSEGDFCYTRSEEKTYEYSLKVFGTKKSGSSKSPGAIFRYP